MTFDLIKGIVLLMSIASAKIEFHDHMKDALDDMSYHYNGPGIDFNETFYSELV